MTWQERRKMKKAQQMARVAAGKERAACLSAVEEERKQRRWWLLSPLAVGVLAELAFDVAVESVPLQEFFAALHALLSACVALGVHVVAAELEADGRTSHLVAQWGLSCPPPHGLATLGGLIGLLRLRGAGIMAAAAGPGAGSNARITAAARQEKLANKKSSKRLAGTGGEALPLRPVPLSQRIWVRKLELTMDTPSSGCEPPRPSLTVDAWAEAAPSVHAAAAAIHASSGGLPVPRLQWPPLANTIYERMVEAVEFGGGGMGLGWQAVRLTAGVHPSVQHGYMATPCFSVCKHCRLELLEMELALASAPEGFGRDRPPHHRTAEGIAVCHAEGMTYTFRLPQPLAVAWCIQAALHVRNVALCPVLDPRAPAGTFLLEDEPPVLERGDETVDGDDEGGGSAGLLTVRLIQARNLKKMDMVGGADPFVSLKCGDEPEQKSKIIKRNRNPRWEASFEFPSPASFVVLDVNVFDWDRLGKNESMGIVSLPVGNMDGTVRWYPLMPTADCPEPEGEIQLQCTAEFPDLRPAQTDEDDTGPLPGSQFGDMAWSTQFRPDVGDLGLVPLGHGTLCRIPEGSEVPTVTVGLKSSLVAVSPPHPTPVEKQTLRELETKAERAARDHRGVRVRVHIVAGRGLKKMDRFGKADPFVTIDLGGTTALRAAAEMSKDDAAGWKQAKTAVVKNSLAPRWDEACEMTFPTQIATSSDCRVELTVYDWDAVGANDPMGKVVLPLAAILNGKFELGQGVKPPEPELESEPEPEPEMEPEIEPEPEPEHSQVNETKQERKAREKQQKDQEKMKKQAKKEAEKQRKQEEKEEKNARKEAERLPQQDKQKEDLEPAAAGPTDDTAKQGEQNAAGDSQGIQDPEGLWLPLRPLVGGDDDDDSRRNEILVTIFRASGLKVMDKNLFSKGGSSDPFVEVRYGDESVKSTVKKKTLAPDWRGEVVSIPVLETADPESEVILTVWDWDRVGSNDFMGRASVTLGELLAAASAEQDGSDDSDVEVQGEGEEWATPEEQAAILMASREAGTGGGRRRKAVLMNEAGMEDEDTWGQITYSVRWVHNAEIAAERRQQLADVQGEILLRVTAERLPQTAAEAASQHNLLLKLLDAEGPQWPVGVPVVCTLPPPVTTKVEVAVRYVTKSGTAMGGVGYLEKEGTLFFSLGPHRPTQTLLATPKLLHDPLRFERDFDAKGDEHFFVRLLAAKVLSVKGGALAEQPKLQISDGRRTSTVVIDGIGPGGRAAANLSATSAQTEAPAKATAAEQEDLGLKAAREASKSWVPFVGSESTCSRCGRLAREHLDGVVWPECVAEHGPPFVYLRRPRVDVMHSSALAPLEVRRHQIAWLSRPVLALHREGKAARRRTRRLERAAHEARRQARRGATASRAPQLREHGELRPGVIYQHRSQNGGWDSSPLGVAPDPPRNRHLTSEPANSHLVHAATVSESRNSTTSRKSHEELRYHPRHTAAQQAPKARIVAPTSLPEL